MPIASHLSLLFPRRTSKKAKRGATNMNTYCGPDIIIDSVDQSWRAFLTSAKIYDRSWSYSSRFWREKWADTFAFIAYKRCKTDKSPQWACRIELLRSPGSVAKSHVLPARRFSVHEGQQFSHAPQSLHRWCSISVCYVLWRSFCGLATAPLATPATLRNGHPEQAANKLNYSTATWCNVMEASLGQRHGNRFTRRVMILSRSHIWSRIDWLQMTRQDEFMPWCHSTGVWS